jgi:hypothetical protein
MSAIEDEHARNLRNPLRRETVEEFGGQIEPASDIPLPDIPMKFRTALGFTAVLMIGLPASSRAQNTAGSPVSDSATKSSEGPLDTWSGKPIGAYDLVIVLPERKMPAALTISETNGRLSALLWPEGDHDGKVMDVAVKGVDLVLSTVASRGPVTITIEKRGKTLSGTWVMGMEHGSLTGNTKS